MTTMTIDFKEIMREIAKEIRAASAEAAHWLDKVIGNESPFEENVPADSFEATASAEARPPPHEKSIIRKTETPLRESDRCGGRSPMMAANGHEERK